MQVIPQALQPMTAYDQWIIWTVRDNKKLPINPNTLAPTSAVDTASHMSAPDALAMAETLGEEYRVGFVFTESDPFFFLDIDHALEGGKWSDLATTLISAMPGAAIEISQSGEGLHIFGTGDCPPHACKNVQLGIELYTENRFVALTGDRVTGDAGLSCQYLPWLVQTYFPPKVAAQSVEWTDGPVEEANPIEDDAELIAAACNATSAASAFGGGATFADLWYCNADVLGAAYPPNDPEVSEFDGSSADAALAQHLAFWTGNDCERIERLMRESSLARDKWDIRTDYMQRTIGRAASLQSTWYGQRAAGDAVEEFEAAPLKGSAKQVAYAESVRYGKIQQATPEEREVLLIQSDPGLYCNNPQATPTELVQMVTPITETPSKEYHAEPQIVTGYQFMTADMQLGYFKGFMYVQDIHRVLTPEGTFLKKEQFDSTYGGYQFQLDHTGNKTVKSAWEAFTQSQCIQWPKANGICFRPALPAGQVVEEEGRKLVNKYVPIDVPRVQGDPSPFLNHLARVLPVERDRQILLSYMAACVQHKGVKFQWAPLLQGVQGNGKTLFSLCIMHAVGKRYTHMPKAENLDSNFNIWLLDKLFVGVEEIKVTEKRQSLLETLKPMITAGNGIEIEGKGVDQITADICANFLFTTNHRDALKTDDNERRFAMFFTAQQTKQDLIDHGMSGRYFPELYAWLNGGGYHIVNELLHTYQIPDEFNPAGGCHRAPWTSSTEEAVHANKGALEHEVQEAIEEGRPGFRGGWISSIAFDDLIEGMRLSRAITRSKRHDILLSMGYIWHPSLEEGRAHMPMTGIDGGKRPKIYVHTLSLSAGTDVPAAEVVRLYAEAQGVI